MNPKASIKPLQNYEFPFLAPTSQIGLLGQYLDIRVFQPKQEFSNIKTFSGQKSQIIEIWILDTQNPTINQYTNFTPFNSMETLIPYTYA